MFDEQCGGLQPAPNHAKADRRMENEGRTGAGPTCRVGSLGV